MMNCFEARQDFVSFWRGALDGERRRELLAHLMGCAKCDRALRTFALTAPMLHSGGAAAEEAASSATQQHASRDVLHIAPQVPRSAPAGTPIDLSGVRSADADRAVEILRRASVYRLVERRPRRAWRDAAAGLSAVAAAVLLAYFSIAAPSQSFDDILANSDSISETATQPDTDFLGQQMPATPTVSNDFAG
jgi:hypothetical protein